jgi:1-acyl-sn-glycerol-3-phosphate acyltransferase
MYALMRLSGQEYVDVYASSVKERLASAKTAGKKAAKKPDRVGDPSRQAAVRLEGSVPAQAVPTSDTSLPPSVESPLPGEVRTIGREQDETGKEAKAPIRSRKTGAKHEGGPSSRAM